MSHTLNRYTITNSSVMQNRDERIVKVTDIELSEASSRALDAFNALMDELVKSNAEWLLSDNGFIAHDIAKTHPKDMLYSRKEQMAGRFDSNDSLLVFNSTNNIYDLAALRHFYDDDNVLCEFRVETTVYANDESPMLIRTSVKTATDDTDNAWIMTLPLEGAINNIDGHVEMLNKLYDEHISCASPNKVSKRMALDCDVIKQMLGNPSAKNIKHNGFMKDMLMVVNYDAVHAFSTEPCYAVLSLSDYLKEIDNKQIDTTSQDDNVSTMADNQEQLAHAEIALILDRVSIDTLAGGASYALTQLKSKVLSLTVNADTNNKVGGRRIDVRYDPNLSTDAKFIISSNIYPSAFDADGEPSQFCMDEIKNHIINPDGFLHDDVDEADINVLMGVREAYIELA